MQPPLMDHTHDTHYAAAQFGGSVFYAVLMPNFLLLKNGTSPSLMPQHQQGCDHVFAHLARHSHWRW